MGGPKLPGGGTPALTEMLQAWSRGDADAEQQVFAAVYVELRRQAARLLRREKPGHSLQPSAVVNEAYLQLARLQDADWPSRAHFFAMAARVMRHVLVDHARRRRAGKRAGLLSRVTLDEGVAADLPPRLDVIALDRALEELRALDPDQARIVDLRFFAGLSVEETADVEGISPATVKREWRTARLWLARRLDTPGEPGPA
jgi:RNA polymerase sigma factor (TIGR02999 family)